MLYGRKLQLSTKWGFHSIKMDLEEMGQEGLVWIHLAYKYPG
jgi:hypothetical protein